MDGLSRQMLDKVPLAEATLRVLSFVLADSSLEDIYQKHRGRMYTKKISLPLITHLICDALLGNKSGRRVFEKAHEEKTLPASVKAAYGKLGRLPPAVSVALLDGCSERVEQLFPEGCEETALPSSLEGYTAIVLDGKVTKKIPHRLKPLRDAKVGGLVGGRGLVAYHLQSGLVLGMEAHEDGDANELSLVNKLAAKLRTHKPTPRLWIADRQFGFPRTLAEFSHDNDAFVVRYSKSVPFFADDSKEPRRGQDDEGRKYIEEWGWLGSEKLPHRCFVRRIKLQRDQAEEVIVLTNLQDADRWPAKDLLEVYRNRTNIEYVFQRITEVFSLRRLIGTSARATLFQLSLCLLLYNVLQLVRAYIARTNAKKMDEVSPKKVLEDIREQLAACLVLLGIASITDSFANPGTAEIMKQFLSERLNVWEKRWTKAKRHRHRPETIKRRRGHDSVYRVMQRAAKNE